MFIPFFSPKLWDRWVGYHWKEDNTKFRYSLEMKLEEFRNHAICWWHARTEIWQIQKQFLTMWRQCVIFSPKTAFVPITRLLFSNCQDAKFHQKKKHWLGSSWYVWDDTRPTPQHITTLQFLTLCLHGFPPNTSFGNYFLHGIPCLLFAPLHSSLDWCGQLSSIHILHII
jgi:hypothetical protein